MIEAEQSALRHRSRAAEMVELNDLAVLRMLFSVRPETHRIGAATDNSHSQHFLVERDRSLEIRDLKSDSAEVRRLGQAVSFRTDSVLLACFCRHLPGCHSVLPACTQQAANATPRCLPLPACGRARTF